MSMKVPLVVAASLICLALGGGAGVAAMMLFGYQWQPQERSDVVAQPPQPKGGPPLGGPGKGGMPFGGGPGKGGMPFGGAGKGPSSKTQLANLVGKLEVLTKKPLSITLDDERKKGVREQLERLDKLDELSEDDAKRRLDALVEILKADREQFEAVGFRWPGQKTGFQPPMEPPNPFRIQANSDRLKALEERLK
jgi:hypothetical protein